MLLMLDELFKNVERIETTHLNERLARILQPFRVKRDFLKHKVVKRFSKP